jgi:2-succinyl-6-hydroxy-2,4-cyclohexadiene-1-carboxylate synthase
MTPVTIRGATYEVEVRGQGPTVLLLHGFTGTLEAWEPVLPAFDGFRTVRLDFLGHGVSDAPDDPRRYAMAETVADLTALLDALGIERAAVVGYSMGGRVALRLAVAAPQRCWALVLESASPGIPDPDERRRRIESDEELARKLEREGIEAFVAYWESLPLWASQASLPDSVRGELRRRRLAQRPLGLANSLRGLGAGRDEPLLGQLGPRLAGIPVLILTGALDAKYVSLAQAMAGELPGARWVNVPGVGHAVHLEAPEAYIRAVRSFLCDHAPTTLAAEQER